MVMTIGLVVALIGGLWLVVLAFKKSVWWGLGSLFVPFVSLVFAIKYWSEAKIPFLISLAGGIVYGIGMWSMMSAGGMA